MVQWVPIFLFPKPWETSKNLNNIIKTPWKVMIILKIWSVWLKNQARHAPLNIKKEIAVSRSILGLEEVSRSQNDEKVIVVFWFLWLFALACTVFAQFSKTRFFLVLLFTQTYKIAQFIHLGEEKIAFC